MRGSSAEQRRALRVERARGVVDDLRLYLDARLRQVSAKSKLAEAIRYALNRWAGLTVFLDDGRVELDSNTVERSIRPIAATDSYCTSSSNARKQGLLVFHFDATRASVTRKLRHFVLFQIRSQDLMRRIGYHLLGGQHALFYQSADAMSGNPKLLGGFG